MLQCDRLLITRYQCKELILLKYKLYLKADEPSVVNRLKN